MRPTIDPKLRLLGGLTALVGGALALVACDAQELDARSSTIASVLADADQSYIRGRPALARSKYEVMTGDLFSFYRGAFPLYLHDAEEASSLSPSDFLQDGLVPITIGDAHPENFGAMRASDDTFAIEPNDFDAADRYPYLWEVRRLAIGMVIATRSSNTDDPTALATAVAAQHDIAARAASGYADEIRAIDGGSPLDARLTDGGGNPVLQDIFARADKDIVTRPELDTETVFDAAKNHRVLIRGVVDPTSPGGVLDDLPRDALDALPDTIARYRETLIAPPDPSYFKLLDAARVFGSGVASLPKVRVLLLVDGPSSDPGDDVILELKELGESGAPGLGRPAVTAGDPDDRVVGALHLLWSRPDADPLWGASSLLGLDVQIKGEFDAYKGVKVKRLVGDRGTPEAIEGLAYALGQLVARMHARGSSRDPGMLHAIASTIGRDSNRFVEEQADVAVRYADVVEGDFGRFQHVVAVLGPRLGIPEDPADAPPPDEAALFGTPPEGAP